jgi:RNA polymerase sigma factor (sigma-70 family)
MGGSSVNSGVGEAASDLGSGVGSFEVAFRNLRMPMLRVAFLAVGSAAVAEEIVQEAFLRLHRQFDEVENPGGFVRTVVVRLCLTWRDRQATERRALAKLTEPPTLGEPVIDTMWEKLARLPPDRRMVLVLRYYEDLSNQEIADLLECPTATVRSRVRRGLIDLRKELRR